jgi:hypothetical protein
MDFTEFTRIPFSVKAVQITEENLDEICELIGKEIKTTEDGRRFIIVDRRIIQNGHKAHVGGWVTQMDDKLRYYSKGSFKSQFVPSEEIVPSYETPSDVVEDSLEPEIEIIVEMPQPEEETGYEAVPDVAGGDV